MPAETGRKNTYLIAVICALLTAVCLGIKTPVFKLAIESTSPVMTTLFVNLGLGVGMLFVYLIGYKTPLVDKNSHLQKKDWPVLAGVILTAGIGAVCSNFGIATTSAATSTVLMNMITVFTALIAYFIFKEKISKRLAIGIIFTTFGVIALTVPDISLITIAPGTLLILGSAVLSSFSNNFTRVISGRNPVEITILKGFGITVIALATALIVQAELPALKDILLLMLLGFVISGLINIFTVYALRHLGAAKAGAITGTAPVIGIIVSFLLYAELPTPAFLASLLLVIPGLYFVITKNTRIAAAENEPMPPQENDESPIFASMTEEWRNQARNYLCAFGFILLVLPSILLLLSSFETPELDLYIHIWHDSLFLPWTVCAVCLCVCGIILLILRKRVLFGVTFFYNGIALLYLFLFDENIYMSALIGISMIVFALILLTAKSKQKYIFVLLNGISGLIIFFCLLYTSFAAYVTSIVLMLFSCAVLIYFAVACASERKELPFKQYLTSNQDMDFRKCGSVIGYLFIAMIITASFIYGFVEMPAGAGEPLALGTTMMIGVLFIITMLLFFIGKRKFTSIMFFGIGLTLLLNTFCHGMALYASVLLLLLLAVFAVMRRNSHLLVSILVIMLSFSTMMYIQYNYSAEIMMSSLLIDISCIALALYLAFTAFSDKIKLPLF